MLFVYALPLQHLIHYHCSQFLLGITVVTREFEDNGYSNVLAVKQGALWST